MQVAAIGYGDNGGGGETRVAVRRWLVDIVNDGGGDWRSVDQFDDTQTKHQKMSSTSLQPHPQPRNEFVFAKMLDIHLDIDW